MDFARAFGFVRFGVRGWCCWWFAGLALAQTN